jgi:threonine/homoserine/homoserine lactone efflux protein
MTLHSYLLFLGASVVLVLIPGPDMIYMLSRCVAQGRKAGPINLDMQKVTGPSAKTILWQAFLSDALNPKVAMFFLALLPQFVDPKASHPTLQILLLGVTVNVIALIGNIVLVTLSASVTASLRRNTSVAALLQKALGATFVALGLRLAVEKN